MDRFGMRAMLALAVLATAGGAATLAAQTVKNPATKPVDDAPRMMQCADGSIVPAGMPCAAPPPPVTSRCPGKIVVRYAAECPDPDKKAMVNANLGQQPTPKTNPGTWVPQDAYPSDALRDGIEGAVGFTLNVGVDGRPTQCHVTSSSGNDALDWAACENLMRRARFNPAKDKKGEPMASTYSNRVRWAIPHDSAPYEDAGLSDASLPRSEEERFERSMQDASSGTFDLQVIMVTNQDGSVETCDVVANSIIGGELTPIPETMRADFCKDRPFAAPARPNGQSKTRYTTTIIMVKEPIAE
jgi:TonB family protein